MVMDAVDVVNRVRQPHQVHSPAGHLVAAWPCASYWPRYDGCDPWVGHSKDDWRNGDDDVEDQWADHYSDSLNWYVSEHCRGR